MFDLRPVIYVIGLLVTALGVAMFVPAGLDIWLGNGQWPVFLESAVITCLVGGLTALATSNAVGQGLSIQQTFLLTTGVWLALPVFGAIPFLLGSTDATVTDAFFEAMSGLTTTGATVFSGLETLPAGLNLWRGILQWLGGIGIIVVAMVFLPELRVGGMQIFRSEGFDTFGKILPRATQISARISSVYIALTLACGLAYAAAGMAPFEAVMHALTTVSTGGFSSTDASFSGFSGAAQYVSALFMILAALPFVRYVQLSTGTALPLFRDSQIRAFLATAFVVVLVLTLWRWAQSAAPSEEAFRGALFNVTSILTGTGYASADYQLWGGFPVALIFFVGLIGGCAGSTSCSIKVFRYQLLFAAIKTQVRRIFSPSGIFKLRYEGRPISDDVLSSVMAFFFFYVVSLGVLAVLLSLTGLDVITSVSGSVAAISNIGPGLGAEIGPSGNYGDLNTTAKWLLAIGMFVGRLELLAVLALFTRSFWRS